MPYQPIIFPPRPMMPDQDRAEHQRARASILDEDFDEVLDLWLRDYVAPEVLETWGQPDTSNNPLVSYVSQLTTPGRYSQRPIVHHPSEAAAGLLDPGGALDAAGWTTKAQTYERRTIGLGDYFVGLDVAEGGLVLQLVEPCDVYLESDPRRPDRPRALWHLRLRWDSVRSVYRWTFTVYDLGRDGTGPSLRVVSATEKDESGGYRDLSEAYLEGGALVGDAYPYRYEDGRPFLPWVQYRSSDTGKLWHWSELRGLHRGTLHVCTYATYTGRAALDATGSHVLTWNLQLPGGDVRLASGRPYDDGVGYTPGGAPIEQVPITPGAISACQVVEPGVQPGVSVVGPGINLAPLHAFTRGYIHDLMLNRGLGQASVEKVSANPASGAALHISDRQRREYQERVEPLFRGSDLELLGKAAAVLNRATGTDYPEVGYSIVYHRPPRSPGEEKDARERDEWLVSNGYRSKVDVYRARYPGLSTSDAVEDLRRIRRDEALVASGAIDDDRDAALEELEAAASALRAMPMEHDESTDALASVEAALAALTGS